MKKCVRCGRDIPDVADFCSYCGTRQVLDGSLQDSGINPSKAGLYNKMNWEIVRHTSEMGSVFLKISSDINDVILKLQEDSIDSLIDFFSDGTDDGSMNSKSKFYPEVLAILKSAKEEFDKWYFPTLQFLKEVKAAIIKDIGEEIDISSIDLGDNFFYIPSGLNTMDLADTLCDLNIKFSDYQWDVGELMEKVGDKIDEIVDQLSKQE